MITASMCVALAMTGCAKADYVSTPPTVNESPDSQVATTSPSDAQSPSASPSDTGLKNKNGDPTYQAALDNLEYIPEDTAPYTGKYLESGHFGIPAVYKDGSPCSVLETAKARDMSDLIMDKEDNCAVQYGILKEDPFTGEEIPYAKDDNKITVVHIITPKYAMSAGANGWNQMERLNFAKDTDNMLPVHALKAQERGDKGPGQWLVPDNPNFQCTYALKWVMLAKKYHLELGKDDKDALAETLVDC